MVGKTRSHSATGLEQICVGVDAVMHMARMNTQDCAADPVAALDFNALATARLLRAAVRQGVKRFIYISTADVNGNPLNGVITEKPARLRSIRTPPAIVLGRMWFGPCTSAGRL